MPLFDFSSKKKCLEQKNKNNLKRDPFYATLTATVWGSGKMAGNICLDVKCELCICALVHLCISNLKTVHTGRGSWAFTQLQEEETLRH